MTRFRIAAIALVAMAALLGGSAIASGAGSVKIVTFKAKYTGTATVKQTGDVVDISGTGKGTGTPIGAGTVSGVGKGDASQQPCVPWIGTGVMKGKKGTVTFKVIPGSVGCGDDGGTVSINAKAQVTKATGTLLKAKGTLKLTGVYDRNAGTFSATFSGKLKQ